MENEIKKEEELSTPLETIKKEENTSQNKLSTPMAIIVAGVLIAGAVYFSSIKSITNAPTNGNDAKVTAIAPVGPEDKILGNPKAKVTLVVYADFQCPFCGAIAGLNLPVIKYMQEQYPGWNPFMPEIINKYVKNGNVLFVYRDFTFLGQESIRASQAARCAGDQNKFWEYHDYLYSHQDGENKGNFSDTKLKSFAKNIKLDTTIFDKCFDSNKYEKAVADSKSEGSAAGITGTPKGFILKNGKIVSTIDGAESLDTVQQKIDAALK